MRAYKQLSILGLVAVVACTHGTALTDTESTEPVAEAVVEVAVEQATVAIADTDFGLAKGSVFEVLVPEAPAINKSDPGDLPAVARAFEDFPPVVPHAVDEFTPVTLKYNDCVDCHMYDPATQVEGDPTPISLSHYTDLRSDDAAVTEEIVGARWVCLSCHVAGTETVELVGNNFGQ